MTEEFNKALAFTLSAEGGFSDNPSDHGGATNAGITQATYSQWLKSKGMPDSPVRSISLQEVRQVYFDLYWDRPHLQLLADSGLEALTISVFDWGVNSGPSRAVKALQGILSVSADGILGALTVRSALSMAKEIGPDGLTLNYNTARMKFYINLVKEAEANGDNSQDKFLKGWENRVLALESYLKSLSPPSVT